LAGPEFSESAVAKFSEATYSAPAPAAYTESAENMVELLCEVEHNPCGNVTARAPHGVCIARQFACPARQPPRRPPADALFSMPIGAPTEWCYVFRTMNVLKAHVRNGRLVLDEPTDLAEGSEVPLQIADDWDELGDDERDALHREIAASITERRAGTPTFAANEVLAELGTKR
jgi:hypothetical protein